MRQWSGSVVVTAYDSESGRPGSGSWVGQYTMRLRSLHRAYPSLYSSGVVHWVPEHLNIKAVTAACKLIDGCSLVLCSATPSVVSAGICHINKVNSTAWLYRDGPSHEIVSFTHHIDRFTFAKNSESVMSEKYIMVNKVDAITMAFWMDMNIIL